METWRCSKLVDADKSSRNRQPITGIRQNFSLHYITNPTDRDNQPLMTPARLPPSPRRVFLRLLPFSQLVTRFNYTKKCGKYKCNLWLAMRTRSHRWVSSGTDSDNTKSDESEKLFQGNKKSREKSRDTREMEKCWLSKDENLLSWRSSARQHTASHVRWDLASSSESRAR